VVRRMVVPSERRLRIVSTLLAARPIEPVVGS
jgi:hypothetical protein